MTVRRSDTGSHPAVLPGLLVTDLVYDCCYLALAGALECRLVTADRPFCEAFINGPHGSHLLWFTDPI